MQLALKNHFQSTSSLKVTILKIIEHLSQNQVNKLNCLCHIFSQVTYARSRGYISISSAKYDGFMGITKFVSLITFHKNSHFQKQNKLKLDETNHNHF